MVTTVKIDMRKGSGMSPRRFDEPSEADSKQPVSGDRQEEVKAALGELRQALDEKGFAARIVHPTTAPPFVRATSPEASELSENVTCGLGEGGELWFHYSWGDPIVPVQYVESAAERVVHIITPRGL